MKQQDWNASNGPIVVRLAGLGLAGLLLGAPAARAGLVAVAPGGSAVLSGSAYVPASGTLVAQSSTPFTATYQPDGTFVNFSGMATGQFDQEVLSDPKTGQLTFAYDVELNNEGITSGSAGSELTLAGFSGYQTNVAGQLQFAPSAAVQRSANGSSLSFYANGSGPDGAPSLNVKTNATRFDANGSGTYSLTDLFLVDGPHGQVLTDVSASVTFKSVFRPIGPAATTGGAGGTAVAVPLPPAAYTGIGIMLAFGVISLCRRLMGG